MAKYQVAGETFSMTVGAIPGLALVCFPSALLINAFPRSYRHRAAGGRMQEVKLYTLAADFGSTRPRGLGLATTAVLRNSSLDRSLVSPPLSGLACIQAMSCAIIGW
jgi:hypothetical protein